MTLHNEWRATEENESRSVVYKAIVENGCDREMAMRSIAQQGVEHFTTVSWVEWYNLYNPSDWFAFGGV